MTVTSNIVARRRGSSAMLPPPAPLRVADLVTEGVRSVRARAAQATLSVVGVAVGMASLLGMVGIADSSQAQLLDQIHRLGTNLLTVGAGQTIFGQPVPLDATAVGMVARIPGVQSVSAVGAVPGASVRRTDQIDAQDTGGVTVYAAHPGLLATLRGTVLSGVFLNAATSHYPVTVLGWVAAARLGLDRPGETVWIQGRRFLVIGILAPMPLAPDIERGAVIGWPEASSDTDFDGHPTTIYERSQDDDVARVLRLLTATVSPGHPEEVVVNRPSDALEAALAAKTTLSALVVGLGAVALVIGGLAVGNTMTISVLQRTGEVGLRRSLGASRGQIAVQIISESVLICTAGGLVGSAIGTAAALWYARAHGWPPVVEGGALGASAAGSVLIGSLAGLYPARRAAALPPTVALARGMPGG